MSSPAVASDTDEAPRRVARLDHLSDGQRSESESDLRALITAGAMSQAACVAAELRIPDLLASRPRQVTELAHATGTHAPSLRRLLRALASLDLCAERSDGSFELGAMGDLLRTDAPNSLRSWAVWCGTHMWPVWGSLRRSVTTGASAQKFNVGTDGFAHLERDSEKAALFNQAMVELTRLTAIEVVRAYDFTGLRRIVDVGGGYGTMLLAVLQAHPRLQGTLFDMAHAIAGARTSLAQLGLADRCELVVGDFFVSLPAGADAYLLKNVIHDWDDERSALILRNCRCVIPENGRLLLVERVMPQRMTACPEDRAMAWMDLVMLLGPGGRERTEAEFRLLLSSCGFELSKVVPTSLEYSILEGIPS